jgi:DNA-binding protein WhiA
MSFSLKVKEEILKVDLSNTEKISLLSAYLRNKSIVMENKIVIDSENEDISNFIFNLIDSLYGIKPTLIVKKKFNFKDSYSYILEIDSKNEEILRDLCLLNSEGYFIDIPKEYIYDGDEEKSSYIRGLFLAIGSINDPNSSTYHLEFSIDDYDYAVFLCELLDNYMLNSKLIERKTGFIVYIKESEKIGDFLRIIKAYNAVMFFEDVRIYKDHKNMVNRLNNCEQANVEKVFNSAAKQIEDIDLIEQNMGIDLLDDKLKEIAIYRKKYPESSLIELSEIISLETGKKVSKSGINHRFRKLREIADKFR